MTCPKCRGRMSAERYYDFVRAFDAWKCHACGEVLDPTIMANRARNNNVFLG
jgi:NAD-dependent SIR2 family protein deacetylase